MFGRRLLRVRAFSERVEISLVGSCPFGGLSFRVDQTAGLVPALAAAATRLQSHSQRKPIAGQANLISVGKKNNTPTNKSRSTREREMHIHDLW